MPSRLNTLDALSRERIDPFIHEQVYNSIPFLNFLVENEKVVSKLGLQIQIPVQLSTPPASQAVASGYDLITTPPFDVVRNVEFNWKWRRSLIWIDWTDLARNASDPTEIANIFDVNSQIAIEQMTDDIAADCMGNTIGTNNIDGIFAYVDNTVNYGGVTRAVDTNWQSTVDSSTPAVSESLLQTGFTAAVKGSLVPDLGLTTLTLYNIIHGILTPMQTVTNDSQGRLGFRNGIFYNGAMIIYDSKTPASTFAWLNTKTFELRVNPNANLSVGEFQESERTDTFVAKLRFDGALVGWIPRANWKATALVS